MWIRNSKVLCMSDPYLDSYLYLKRVKVHMLPNVERWWRRDKLRRRIRSRVAGLAIHKLCKDIWNSGIRFRILPTYLDRYNGAGMLGRHRMPKPLLRLEETETWFLMSKFLSVKVPTLSIKIFWSTRYRRYQDSKSVEFFFISPNSFQIVKISILVKEQNFYTNFMIKNLDT